LAFLAFGSLLQRREIVHDTRQLQIDEIRFSFPFRCNGMPQWWIMENRIAFSFSPNTAIRMDMGEYPFC